jgi:hypothetical protein
MTDIVEHHPIAKLAAEYFQAALWHQGIHPPPEHP